MLYKNIVAIFLTFIIVNSVEAKPKLFIPIQSVEQDIQLDSTNIFSVDLWCSWTSSSKLFATFLEISCTDSITIKFFQPKVLTKKGMQPFDIWTVMTLDTITHQTELIKNLYGYGEDKSMYSEFEVGAGSYKLQCIYFQEYHPKITGKDCYTEIEIGGIICKDSTAVLNNIRVMKSDIDFEDLHNHTRIR